MNRLFAFLYGIAAYLLFLAAFTYAVGFVTGLVVPKTIDSGSEAPWVEAVLINLALLGLFGIQHSIMARPGFKRWWTRIVPASIERSTFVLATCVVLGLLFWEWRPLPDVVWAVEDPVGRTVLWALSWTGWGIVLLSTFLIDHFELFGAKQVILYALGRPYPSTEFRERSLYRVVRHPLMLGFLIAFWSAPVMTAGHLLFAAVTTAYILVAIQLEERDLVAAHGDSYRDYRRRVPMLLPLSWGRPRPEQPEAARAGS